MSQCPHCATLTFAELKEAGEKGVVLYEDVAELIERVKNGSLKRCLCNLVWWSLRFSKLQDKQDRPITASVKLFLNPPNLTPRYLDVIAAKPSQFNDLKWNSDVDGLYRLGPPYEKRGIRRARLRLYDSAYASNTERRVQTRSLAPTSGSPECLKLAESWLRSCNTCSAAAECRPKSSFLPTRLLDLRPGDKVQGPESSIRLCSTSSPTFERSEYAALSYCWGKGSPLRKIKRDLDIATSAISPDDLPSAIRDAVFVARQLGFRYLWVDAHCIDQASRTDESADWLREVSQTHEVYGNASLTIVAGSRDVHESFLSRQRSSPVSAHVPLKNDKCDMMISTAGRIFAGPELFQDQNIPDPTRIRGWTLQEELLSRRVLFFGREEIAWRCQCRRQFEHEAEPRRPNELIRPAALRITDIPSRIPEGSHSVWKQVVEEYSSRQLTFPSDKIPAIKGLEQQIMSDKDSRCVYGIVHSKATLQLLWRMTGRRTGFLRTHVWRAPSWSWMATDSQIFCPSWGDDEGWLDAARLTHFPDTEGTLADSYIDIEAYVKPIEALRLRPASWYRGERETFAYWKTMPSGFGVFIDDVESVPPNHQTREPNAKLINCYFLFLSRKGEFARGLVLLRVDSESSPQYRRIGIFENFRADLAFDAAGGPEIFEAAEIGQKAAASKYPTLMRRLSKLESQTSNPAQSEFDGQAGQSLGMENAYRTVRLV